jgi:hypothetical protein
VAHVDPPPPALVLPENKYFPFPDEVNEKVSEGLADVNVPENVPELWEWQKRFEKIRTMNSNCFFIILLIELIA